jgi:anti-anti-sigma regulatory factor
MRVGDLIAERFELEHLAGTGGMGAVYRARDRRSGERVAVKSLSDPGGRHTERFLREAEVLATLHHPNVVRYLSHGRSTQGELYMAMEWVEGESLSARIGSAGLGVAEAIEVVIQLASALAFAHARGVIHRDIKPSNVFMVQGTLIPKLLDFGIARLQEAARLTSNGMMLGTPGYMAPEQARGAANVSARADVFSLGCLLFKCIAARPPFVGEDVRAVMAQVLFEPAPRLATLRPGVPPAVDALVSRMLAKEPSQRPADGAEVLAELRALASDVPGLRAAADAVEECIGDAELQFICAVLAREATVPTFPSLPVPRLDASPHEDPGGRTSSAFEIPITGGDREVSPEIGTVVDSLALAPTDIAEALRGLDAEVDQLADGSLLCALSEPAEPVALALRAARCAQVMLARRPELRIVITTGRALRSEHPGVGPALDRAAALLRRTVALPAGICLDATTAALLEERFQLEDGSAPRLMGEREPMLERAAPPLGRDRELARWMDFVARTRAAGHPAWGLMIGAQGIGLTALLRGLRAQLQVLLHAPEVLAATADPSERHTPLAFLRRLLPGVPLVPDDVSLLQARLHARAHASGLVLLIDDLDHVDDASLVALIAALPSSAPVGVAVICGARPRVLDRIERLGLGGELRELGPLSTEVMGQVAPGPVHSESVSLARGNPGLLRLLVKGPANPRLLPEPVIARTAARLEEIPPEARRVLRAVAIWGGHASRSDLAVLLAGGTADPGTDAQLDLLVRGSWIERGGQEGLWGEPSFRIPDPLVAAAAVAQFPELDRARAHRLIAARLEQRAEPDAGEVARHWEAAGQVGRAAAQYLRGAVAAQGAEHLAQAAEFARRGLRVAREAALRGPLLEVAAEAELWQGTPEAAAEAVRALESLALPLSPVQVRALRLRALAAVLRRDVAAAHVLATDLLAALPWTDPGAAYSAGLVAELLASSGDVQRALTLAKPLPARADDALEPLAAAGRHHLDAAHRVRSGQGLEAVLAHRAAEDALALAGEPRLAVLARLGAALAALEGLLFVRAEQELGAIRAEATARNLIALLPGILVAHARALHALGQVEATSEALAQAMALCTARSDAVGLALALRLRAESRGSAGALDGALDDALRAVPALAAFPVERLRTQAVIAGLHARRGELSAAVAIARALGAALDAPGGDGRPELVGARRVVAEVLLQAGLRDAGRQQLQLARAHLAQRLAGLDAEWGAAFRAAPDVVRLLELAETWLGPA